MMEEREIKEFEKEQLNKLLIELKDINNFKGFEDGAFKYSLGKYQADLLLNHIDILQQRIDKAIEYVNHMIEELDKRDMLHPSETRLLSILQGEEVK